MSEIDVFLMVMDDFREDISTGEVIILIKKQRRNDQKFQPNLQYSLCLDSSSLDYNSQIIYSDVLIMYFECYG